MTGICRGAHAGAEHLEMARAMFNAVGRTVVVDEKNMDAVTGLSASGPAYAYIILESLAEAGVKVGLPRDVATLLAAQTMKGAASVVLETGDHPADGQAGEAISACKLRNLLLRCPALRDIDNDPFNLNEAAILTRTGR